MGASKRISDGAMARNVRRLTESPSRPGRVPSLQYSPAVAKTPRGARIKIIGGFSRVSRIQVRTFSFLGAGSVAFASRGPWLPRSPSPGGTPRMSTRVPRSRSASRGRSFPGGPTTVRVRPRAILGNWLNSPRPQLECRGCPILTPIPSPDLPSRRPQVPVRRQQRHRIPARDPWGARALGAGQLRRGRSHP